MLYAQANILSRKFALCSVNIKLTLFRAYCTPLYAAHLWVNYKKPILQRLTVAYNDALRLLLKKPRCTSASELFVSNRINPLCAALRKRMYGFICRVNNSLNAVIVELSDGTCSDIRFTSQLKRHWYVGLLRG